MKTNVLLQSESRELLGKSISVMSKDGFVCITEVMEALTKKREKEGLAPKRLDDLMSNKGFQEKMYALVKRLSINTSWTAIKIASQKEDLEISKLTDLKKYNMAYRKGKGEGQKWFVDPYFFVMVALELDPEIYASVVVWLTDGFIKSRNVAGDAYVKMCRSISSLIKNKDELSECIKRVAKAMNYIVFNRHEDSIRNRATEEQLNQITELELAISSIIDCGFISDYDTLIAYLKKEWLKRWDFSTVRSNCYGIRSK